MRVSRERIKPLESRTMMVRETIESASGSLLWRIRDAVIDHVLNAVRNRGINDAILFYEDFKKRMDWDFSHELVIWKLMEFLESHNVDFLRLDRTESVGDLIVFNKGVLILEVKGNPPPWGGKSLIQRRKAFEQIKNVVYVFSDRECKFQYARLNETFIKHECVFARTYHPLEELFKRGKFVRFSFRFKERD